MTTAEQALWDATKTGAYPSGTTAKQLATNTDYVGWTALHQAAQAGHLPNDTTDYELANCKMNNGWSALHAGAQAGHLPSNTTIRLLKTTADNGAHTAWQSLCQFAKRHPKDALELAHQMFAQDHPAAIEMVAIATEKDPRLKSKAALWLSQILAQTPTAPP